MTLTSFVGSFRSRHRPRTRPHLTLNTSLASSQLGTIHSGESLNVESFEANHGSASTSSTCVPASPTGTDFSLAMSSAESMRSFDTQVTTPDDSVLWPHCHDSDTISDEEDEPYSPTPSSATTINVNNLGKEKEQPVVLDAVRTKRTHDGEKRKEEDHDDPCRQEAFVPTELTPETSLPREEDILSLSPSSTTTLLNKNSYLSSRITPFASTMTSSSNERLSFEDNYDPHSVDSGIEYLRMFLKEKWEPQLEMCRITTTTVTLSKLLAIGKATIKEGIPQCRNLISCPGLNDEIAVSLWEFLSGSVPSPDDLQLQDDNSSIVSLEFVERFIIVRDKETTKQDAVVSVQQVDVESVQQLQKVTPSYSPAPSMLPSSTVSVETPSRSVSPTHTTLTQKRKRGKSGSIMPRLKEWTRRQAEALNETGIAMGKGLGSQPYSNDDMELMELRIFLLKSLHHVSSSSASFGVTARYAEIRL